VTSAASHPVLPGADPFSSEGGAEGVLVLHGFTGSPQSVGPLARAFADAGFTVDLPLLPGHGTSLADMMRTDWSDWSTAAETAYTKLATRCESVVVAGLSMGATLAVWLAARHPEIAGLVVVNAAVEPLDPSLVDVLSEMRSQGAATMPGIASDVADPDETELAYSEVPIDGLLSLNEAWTRLGEQMDGLAVPALVMNSPQDHVVARCGGSRPQPQPAAHRPCPGSGPRRPGQDRRGRGVDRRPDREQRAAGGGAGGGGAGDLPGVVCPLPVPGLRGRTPR
jgi:carboxylesterase